MTPDAALSRLQRLAADVGAFWGAGIRVAIDDGSPCFDWQEVRIPLEDAVARSDEALSCLLLHEWGHRCLSPRTVEQAMWWQLMARLEGVRAAREAINIACDLLVDRWYIDHPGVGARYREIERQSQLEFLATPLAQRRMEADPSLAFLTACYAQIGGWQADLADLRLDRDLARAVLDQLFDERQSLDDRIRGFLRAAASVLRTCGEQAPFGSQRRTAGPGSGGPLPTLLGSPHPWIGPDWDAGRLVRLLVAHPLPVPASVLEEECGPLLAREVRGQVRVLESLVRVERDVARLVAVARGQRAEGSTSWRIGDPSHELDAVLTLERAGLLLPGITTLRRRRGRNPVPEAALPRLCLIVDNSGSTTGEVIESELDAAVALLEAARRLRVEAGAIVFGSGVHAAVEPGSEHMAIARLFAALHGQSGGTELAPALARAAAMLPASGQSMATVIFTDSYVYDSDDAVRRMRRLVERGPVVVFAAENSLDPRFVAALRSLTPGPRLVQHHPGARLVDEALAVLQ